MGFSWSITTTSGLLLVLRFAHLLLIFAWLAEIFRPGIFSALKKVLWLPMALALLVNLTGAWLFWRTPSDLHSSWGLAILTGSAISVLMLMNQIISYFYKTPLEGLNVVLALPAVFLMSMGSHLGIQISPWSSLRLAVCISFLPALIVEGVALFVSSSRPLFKNYWLSVPFSLFLTALFYVLLEFSSKL